MTFPPSAGRLPCQKTTAVPANANITSFADQLIRRRDIVNATAAPMIAVGMMFGKSPHLANCTDHPTIASIQINRTSAITSLALGQIQTSLNQAMPSARVESRPESIRPEGTASTRSVCPSAALVVIPAPHHVQHPALLLRCPRLQVLPSQCRHTRSVARKALRERH